MSEFFVYGVENTDQLFGQSFVFQRLPPWQAENTNSPGSSVTIRVHPCYPCSSFGVGVGFSSEAHYAGYIA